MGRSGLREVKKEEAKRKEAKSSGFLFLGPQKLLSWLNYQALCARILFPIDYPSLQLRVQGNVRYSCKYQN